MQLLLTTKIDVSEKRTTSTSGIAELSKRRQAIPCCFSLDTGSYVASMAIFQSWSLVTLFRTYITCALLTKELFFDFMLYTMQDGRNKIFVRIMVTLVSHMYLHIRSAAKCHERLG
jgi:hypothetical protein